MSQRLVLVDPETSPHTQDLDSHLLHWKTRSLLARRLLQTVGVTQSWGHIRFVESLMQIHLTYLRDFQDGLPRAAQVPHALLPEVK